jgi:tRNA pseudouridine55 synthase
MNGGVLLVDKPKGITSHDVVARVRRVAGLRRVGHAGTLDPGATGLLLILLARGTRLSQFLTGLEKSYSAGIRLGEESNTLDADGVVTRRRPVTCGREDLERALAGFLGPLQQLPPMFSAVKVEGRRLYSLARQGIEVEREARPVFVFEIRLEAFDPPEAQIFLRCSSGTYVRSLVQDLGEALGCGALVSELRRISVGPYQLEHAVSLRALEEDPELWNRAQVPLDALLSHFPRRTLSPGEAERVRSGLDLSASEPGMSGWVRLCDSQGHLLAVGKAEPLRVHPEVVLA